MSCTVIILDQEAATLQQPELQFRVSNIEIQCCETLNVVGASGSVGAVSASLKSTCEYTMYPYKYFLISFHSTL